MLQVVTLSVLGIVGIVVVIHKYRSGNKAKRIIYASSGKPVKGTSTTPKFPLGDFQEIVEKPFEFLQKWAVEKISFWWLGGEPMLHINDPQLAEEVLKKEVNFGRNIPLYIISRLVGAKGIISAHGEDWARHRRILYKAFVPKVIESYETEMFKITQEMIEKLTQYSSSNKSIELENAFQKLTLKIMVATAFGLDNPKLPLIMDCFDFLTGQLNNFLFFIPGWRFLPTPTNRKVEKYFQIIDDFVYEMIAKRKKERDSNSNEKRTILDLLLDAEDQEDEGKSFSDEEVRNNIVAFLFAGHETTATTMSWFIYHLCANPHVEEKVREEIDRVLQGKRIQLHHIKELVYFEATFNESMRITPSAFAAPPRICKQQERIGDFVVPPNTLIDVNICSLAINPTIWKEPLQFRPERFLAETKENVHPYAAIPFSAGKRICLGKRFALQEMFIVIVTLLQNFKFELAPQSKKVEICLKFPAVHPKGGLHVFVQKMK